VVRILITLSVAASSILLRDSYAYLNVVSGEYCVDHTNYFESYLNYSFLGAIGCSALALILPCVIHMKLRNQSVARKVVNISVILFSVVASVSAMVEIVMRLVKHTSDHPV
jgi:hypothetical protein